MRFKVLTFVVCFVMMGSIMKGDDRNWQTGTLTATEKQRVPTGSTVNSYSSGSEKDRGDREDYSANTTKMTSDDYDTYELYTIQSGNTVYVASEHLFFPWSKPANLTIGKSVQFSVENNKMYVLDADGKEHTVNIVKTVLK
jgi:hypothetical protein